MTAIIIISLWIIFSILTFLMEREVRGGLRLGFILGTIIVAPFVFAVTLYDFLEYKKNVVFFKKKDKNKKNENSF